MAKLNITKLKTRTTSACIMIPSVLALIYYGSFPFFALIVLLCAICMREWMDVSRKGKFTAMQDLISLAYIIFGFWAAHTVRSDYGLVMASLCILMIWFSDIGAYFAGKLIGGAKMAQKISPNKTWAGFAGATIAPGLLFVGWVCLAAVYRGNDVPATDLLPHIFFAGAAIGVFGQIGDLLVSYMKRKAGVKDTGTIIPGHGGMLDRVDSLLLAVPGFWWLISVYGHGF